MTKYQPPIKDYMFLMYDLFQINHMNKENFSDYTPDFVKPILNEETPRNIVNKKYNNDTTTGITILFVTLACFISWIIYFYFLIFHL